MLVLKPMVTWGSTILRNPPYSGFDCKSQLPDSAKPLFEVSSPQASATTAACSSLILHSTVSTAILPVKLAVPPGFSWRSTKVCIWKPMTIPYMAHIKSAMITGSIWKHQRIHDVGTGRPDGDIWGTPVI